MKARQGRRAYGTSPRMTFKLVPSLPFPPEALVQRPHAESTAGSSHAAAAGVIYAAAFVTGAIVMSFEMLGSRYLNPYFGSGIYTWAALISTVLIALTAGYFLGGALADRTASLAVLALTVIVGSLYLLALPSFAQAVLEFVLESVDDIRAGSLLASLALMFFPVTFLGMYSPFAIRLLLRSAQRSGRVSGAGSPAPPRRQRPRGRCACRVCGACRPRRQSDRRGRSREDARACRRPARPYRNGLQRRLHHQAPAPTRDVVPAQGLGLHRIGEQPSRPGRPAAALRAGDDDRDHLSRDGAENPDARARRRLDLHLSRAFHAAGCDHDGGDRPGRHHRRQDLFRPARDRADALPRRRWARVPQPQRRTLRFDPARRLSRRLRAVSSAHAGVLHAGQAAPHSWRRRRVQHP